jgi:hypothetical protein
MEDATEGADRPPAAALEKTVEDLVAEALRRRSREQHDKRKQEDQRPDQRTSKRPKPSGGVRCDACGGRGHLKAECPSVQKVSLCPLSLHSPSPPAQSNLGTQGSAAASPVASGSTRDLQNQVARLQQQVLALTACGQVPFPSSSPSPSLFPSQGQGANGAACGSGSPGQWDWRAQVGVLQQQVQQLLAMQQVQQQLHQVQQQTRSMGTGLQGPAAWQTLTQGGGVRCSSGAPPPARGDVSVGHRPFF